MTKPIITITTGDPLGIGPLVTFKAISKLKTTQGLQIVHETRPPLHQGLWIDVSKPGVYSVLDLESNKVIHKSNHNPKFYQDSSENKPGCMSARKIEVACHYMQKFPLQNQYLVTAPIHKHRMIRDGNAQFSGHTEYLQHLFDSPEVIMYLKNDQFGVSLLTVHCPIHKVPERLRKMNVQNKIASTLNLLQKWKFPVSEVKILGLNPHAGESGSIGSEELEILTPAIKGLPAYPFKISSPISADTAFIDIPKHCHYIACYHDQGLIPIKTLFSKETINITLGLPIIRTSPDHGTADSIVGQGIEDSTSMECALREIDTIAARI